MVRGLARSDIWFIYLIYHIFLDLGWVKVYSQLCTAYSGKKSYFVLSFSQIFLMKNMFWI